MIHGHAPRGLASALARQAKLGTSFGAPSPLEVELAELVRALVPSMERVRFVSSGTEATMSAARVARGATGRDKIVKFEGCYHGHADGFLVQAGSGALTFGTPTSPGCRRVPSRRRCSRHSTISHSVERLVAANRRPDCRHHRRAGGRQHGRGAAGAWFSRRAARALRSARDAADLRRGDDRLPALGRGARRNSTASRRTSPVSARSSAAACRWLHTADART